jgi:hypothetical protein
MLTSNETARSDTPQTAATLLAESLMSLIASLLPKSFLSWVESEVKVRVLACLGVADLQIALAERELGARHRFTGIKPAKVLKVEDSDTDR